MNNSAAISANASLRSTRRIKSAAFAANDKPFAPPSLPPAMPEPTTGSNPVPDWPAHQAAPGLRYGPTGSFTLQQNHPDQHAGATSIPFTLTTSSDVQLDVFDPQGRKVMGVARKGLGPGEQIIHLNLSGLGLPAGTYSYQVQVANRYGAYRQRQLMTVE